MSSSGTTIAAAMQNEHSPRELLGALLSADECRLDEANWLRSRRAHFLRMPFTTRSAVRLTTKVMANSSMPMRNSTW